MIKDDELQEIRDELKAAEQEPPFKYMSLKVTHVRDLISTIEGLQQKLADYEGCKGIEDYYNVLTKLRESESEVERMEIISQTQSKMFQSLEDRHRALRQEVDRYRTALEKIEGFGGVEYSESYYRMQEIARASLSNQEKG